MRLVSAKNIASSFPVACCAALLMAGASTPLAQEFPTRPVRIVAPFPPGGGTDLNVRRLADRLNKMWRQPVVVQNIAGGAGNVAAVAVAGATPDGYTLFFASHPIFAINPSLHEKLPFNPDRDFTPVVQVSETPHILLVSLSLPVASLPDLVALAKARPGSLNFGSGGQGTSLHLVAELLKSAAGIELTHVPYKGTALAITALIGNEIQLLFDSSTSAIGHIRGGRVRGLAITTLSRLAAVPDLPTFDESGLPGFQSALGHGVLVRSATPAAAVSALNRAINAVLGDPEYKRQMAELGVNLVGGSPEHFRSYLAAERKKWAEIIQKQGIKMR